MVHVLRIACAQRVDFYRLQQSTTINSSREQRTQANYSPFNIFIMAFNCCSVGAYGVASNGTDCTVAWKRLDQPTDWLRDHIQLQLVDIINIMIMWVRAGSSLPQMLNATSDLCSKPALTRHAVVFPVFFSREINATANSRWDWRYSLAYRARAPEHFNFMRKNV